MLAKNFYFEVQSAEQKEENEHEVPMEHDRILHHTGLNFAIGKQITKTNTIGSQIANQFKCSGESSGVYDVVL